MPSLLLLFFLCWDRDCQYLPNGERWTMGVGGGGISFSFSETSTGYEQDAEFFSLNILNGPSTSFPTKMHTFSPAKNLTKFL